MVLFLATTALAYTCQNFNQDQNGVYIQNNDGNVSLCLYSDVLDLEQMNIDLNQAHSEKVNDLNEMQFSLDQMDTALKTAMGEVNIYKPQAVKCDEDYTKFQVEQAGKIASCETAKGAAEEELTDLRNGIYTKIDNIETEAKGCKLAAEASVVVMTDYVTTDKNVSNEQINACQKNNEDLTFDVYGVFLLLLLFGALKVGKIIKKKQAEKKQAEQKKLAQKPRLPIIPLRNLEQPPAPQLKSEPPPSQTPEQTPKNPEKDQTPPAEPPQQPPKT